MSEITVTEATYDFGLKTGELLTMTRGSVMRLVDTNGDVVGWAGTRSGALVHAVELLRQEGALKATMARRGADRPTTAQVIKARRVGRELARQAEQIAGEGITAGTPAELEDGTVVETVGTVRRKLGGW